MLINNETNLLIDKYVKPATSASLKKMLDCPISFLDLKYSDYKKWVEKFCPNYLEIHKHILRKKLIELYTSFVLLRIDKDENYLDAAGGKYTYADKIKCRLSILQDAKISPEFEKYLKGKVHIVKSSTDNIPLKDKGVDCISCHHSFEHFQGKIDIKFLKEIQRLLSEKGRCVIVPIIIGNKYIELTNTRQFKKHFDHEAESFLDESSTLPGREQSGYFARIYDVRSFKRRVLDVIDKKKYYIHIYEIRMDGIRVPHMNKVCNYRATQINFPYRALYIQKKNNC